MSMRNNRNGVKKERIIMLASSALVLTALTVTGIFVRGNRSNESEDNVVDLSALESGITELAENTVADEDMSALFTEVGTDDLDYDPYFQEANSDHVENASLAKKDKENEEDKEEEKAPEASEETDSESGDGTEPEAQGKKEPKDIQDKKSDKENENNEEGMFDESEETMLDEPEDTEAIATTIQPILDFNEEDSLVWPIVGDILINYSMDKTVYFPTLQQYRYHPAIVISATQGATITAAADGKVVSVVNDPQLGNTVVMDLGNQYELTYGQLDNITVSEGSYVMAGDIIGNVAAPTKYYSTEGANVYFKLTKNGEPINPLSKLN